MPFRSPPLLALARVLVLVAVAAGTAILPGTAWAHPFGPPPTATVTAEGRTVVVEWRAAADDTMALGVHLGLLPPDTLEAYQEGPTQVAPSARDEALLASSPELRRYLLEHIVVAQDGRACAGEVVRTEGFVHEGARIAYRCPVEVGAVELRLGMLHAVHAAYRTFALADRAMPSEAVFTATVPARELDFGAGAAGQSGDGAPGQGFSSGSSASGSSASGSSASGSSLPGLTGVATVFDAFERRFLALVEGGTPGSSGVARVGATVAALLVAFLVGAGHALAPGHGKALAGAYLAGGPGRPRDALVLGASVAAMHSASILVLGLGIHALTRDPALGERVDPWLSLAAGVLVLAVGAGLLRRHRHAHPAPHTHVAAVPAGLLRRRRHAHPTAHPHDRDPAHPRGADTAHTHGADVGRHGGRGGEAVSPLSRRGLVLIGLSGGLLPSPSAFLVLATAVFLGRTLYGVALVVAFSVGLATTLGLLGLAVIRGRAAITRRLSTPRLRRAVAVLPLGSAVALTLVGAWLTTVAALRL